MYMDFEERERRKKRQFIKVVIAEVGMVIATVSVVIVSTLASMGFFVASDGTIEQSGLIQIHSIPTGATVDLDGSTLFPRTNLSRTLAPGKHNIRLTKNGYDEWSKDVAVYSGLLTRLYYPRLFLLGRTTARVMELGEELDFYSIANDHTNALYAEKKSTSWQFLSIKGDDVQRSVLDVSRILPEVHEIEKSGEKEFNGQVRVVEWSKDNDYVLLDVLVAEKREWILMSLKNLGESLNLTATFGLNFEKVEMIDGLANQLYALENGHLRKIKTADQSISRVLLDGLSDFASDGLEVVYVAKRGSEASDDLEQVIGVYRDGEKSGTVVSHANRDAAVKVGLSEYYGASYIVFIIDKFATVYYGTIPSYRENVNETDFSGMKSLVQGVELTDVPDSLSMSLEGEYCVAKKGQQMMVIDVDTGDIYEYRVEDGTSVGWLNEAMMYGVKDGGLMVWDFDYTNRRLLVEKVEAKQMGTKEPVAVGGIKVEKSVTTKSSSKVLQYQVMISSDSKWLYYVVQLESSKIDLVREKIRD